MKLVTLQQKFAVSGGYQHIYNDITKITWGLAGAAGIVAPALGVSRGFLSKSGGLASAALLPAPAMVVGYALGAVFYNAGVVTCNALSNIGRSMDASYDLIDSVFKPSK